MMGNRIYVIPDSDRGARWDLTTETVGTAMQKRWPEKVTLNNRDDQERGKVLDFEIDLRDTPWSDFLSWDGTFWEKGQNLAVTYGEPGAMIVEWFMGLIPESVPSLTFTQEITDPVPLPPRPTAEKVLQLTGWYGR
jgi:hypothetical protein